MNKKIRNAAFKVMDVIMILTMVLGMPMNVAAAPQAQADSPALSADKLDYAPGESAHVTGAGFAPGDYVLSANGPDGTADWGTVTADEDGEFASDSPELGSTGAYEVRAYAPGNEAPVASVSFTVTAPPDPTQEPTAEPTATEPPTSEPTAEPTQEPTDEPTATTEPTAEPTLEPTTTPTSEPTNTPTPSGPPTIASDLADYPPGGRVTLTGANWQGDAEVRIIVNDDIGQTWRRDVIVTVATDGTIYDSFNLPSYFVATYSVVATGKQTGRVVTTTFTDSDPKISPKQHQGQLFPSGTYTSGNITTYSEGDSINFRFTLEANHGPSSGTMEVRFSGQETDCTFFDPVFTLGTIESLTGVGTTTVSVASGPVASGDEWVVVLNVSWNGAFGGGQHSAVNIARVNYTLTLSDEAGECNGSSQSSTLASGTGAVNVSGAQNVPVPANQVIELPDITVIKNIDRDGNGSFEDTADAGEYCFSLDGGSCISTNSSGQVIFTNVTPDGAHTITETQLNFSQGTYSFISGSGTNCTFSGSTATATVSSGTTSTNATCTFNNGLTNGTLTIVKVVVNDNGGTKQVSDFPLFYNGNPATSGVPNSVSPGTYTVTETQQSGYTAAFSGDCNASGVVTVSAGQNKTCTITNDDQPATLIVIKHVINDNGGTAVAGNFTMTIDDPGTNPPSFPGAEAPGTAVTVDPGAYSVSESSLAGYTSDGGSTDCSGTIANGQTKTCTFTNDDQASFITVVKVVTNDNGGSADPDDFDLTLDGNPVSSGVAVAVDPGTYTAGETLLSGYTFEGFSGDCNLDGETTVALGESKTCTLTNNDQQAYITVVKVVTNDNGGSADPDDFNLTLDGNAVSSGVAVAVDPGTYTAGETLLSGYTFEGFSGDCDLSGDTTVALGESKTCTLTNNDQQAYITVVKVVTNDNGGSADPDDFNLTLDGNATTSGTPIPVDPGTYTAGETLLSGYTFEGFSGDCDLDGETTVALGESKTCTLTNNDQQAFITVVKVVTNDNGGSADPNDFNLTLDGNATTSGTPIPVDPGTYTAGETLLSGYTFEGFSGDCDLSGDTTVALGESKTCTLTNDDQQAYITVVKVVTNDNGGSADPDDFNLTLDGSPVSSGVAVAVDPGTYTAGETLLSGYTFEGFSGDCDLSGDTTVALGESKTCTLTNNDQQAYITVVKVVTNDNGGSADPDDFNLTLDGNATTSGTPIPVDPGTYTAGETLLSGYTFEGFSGDCNLDGETTVALGESKTCTLTNNDQQAYITVVKVVTNDNGGSADPNDFNLTLDGNATTSGTPIPVDPGTYTAGETLLSGYTFEGFSGDCDLSGDTTVALGESKTCTLTNDDQQAYITVVKVVTNDNGGSADPDDFNLTLDGSPVSSGVAVAVDPGTYTAGETLLSGYTFEGFSGDCDLSGDTTVALGESKTCTLTNNDQQAFITVVKVVTNDNGGSADPDDFNLTLDGNATTSGTPIPVDPGTYTAGETLLSGYTFEGFSGDCDLSGDTTVALGESKTCTLTNNDQQAYITVVKVVTNDNGGSADPNDFNLTLDGNATTSGTPIPVDPGTYTAGETLLSGYTFEGFSGDCDLSGDTTVALGESKTCTLTNDDQQAYITVVKVVTNDNGGSADPDDFNLTLDGSPVSSGVAVAVDPGTYTAGETLLSGYTFEGFSGDCDLSGDTTVALGESKTCTLTNNDQQAFITVVKVVTNDNGGSADPDDFNLTLDGNATTSGTPIPVDPGTYTAGETLLSGYTFEGFSGDCDLSGDTTVALGESKTCTLTNNDQQAFITVVKVVTNDNGGSADPNDFNLTLDGNATTSGTPIPVDPGTYTAGETLLSGYTFEGFSGDCDLSGDTTVALGESKTCTLTNNDQQAYITVVKVVTNDNGGNAQPNDFNLTLDGNATTSGTPIPVDPGTYTAGETLLSGYTFEGFSGDCDLSGDTTVALGESKTCTLTNNDQQAYITVVKVVTNDNGGSADPNDFNLTLDGNATTSGTPIPVDPGTYTAGETLLSGYTFEGFSGDCDLSGDTTVALGESKTCTLTNNDQQAYITVVKVVVNDNGGNAQPNDFNLTLDGNATTSGTPIPVDPGTYTAGETLLSGYTFEGFSGDCDLSGDTTVALGESKTCTLTNNDQQAFITVVKVVVNDNGGNAQPNDFNLTLDGNATTSGTPIPVDPGTYTAGETLLSGYTFEGFSGDCDLSGDTTVALGESKTCTLTNNDQQAFITVVKVVTNDNGGSADPDDFNLTLDGNATTSGTPIPVDPGTYTAGETLLSGYTFEGFSGDCDLSGDTTVALGESKTCTLTNDDVAPTLTLIKDPTNDNGGNAAPDDFNLTIDGNAALSGVAYTLDANTPYAIDETQLSGYTFVSITGDAECPALLGGTVTLDEGENVTCTITNDDVAPKLIVIKHVINDNGGTKVASDWALDSGGNNDSPDDFAGDESGTTVTLDAGSYKVTETGPSGYAASFSADCEGTINVGQTKTCTVTNDDIAPKLIVIKHVINDNGGTKVSSDWTLDSGGTNDSPDNFAGAEAPGTNVTLDAGPYNVTEAGPSGYTASFSADCAGTIAIGQTKTCTVTNNDKVAGLMVTKTPNKTDVCNGSNTQVTYTYVVTNTGEVTLTVNLTDDILGDIDGGSGFTLNPGQSQTFTKSATINGTVTNTVTATGTATSGQTASASASATVTGRTCQIKITKTASHSTICVGANTLVTYTYIVKNEGNVTLTNVSIVDNKLGTIASGLTLTPGQSQTFTKTVAVSTTTTNTATASGTALGTTVTSSASATVTVGTTPCPSPLTPGYWKNHKTEATALLPVSLGNYVVNTFTKVTAVFNKMNCSSTKPNDAIGCLAGHLLAAELNVKNNAGNACIAAVIAKADSFLSGGVVDGVTGINYTGPSATYTLTTAQRNLAISLKNALDKYNNNLGCP